MGGQGEGGGVLPVADEVENLLPYELGGRDAIGLRASRTSSHSESEKPARPRPDARSSFLLPDQRVGGELEAVSVGIDPIRRDPAGCDGAGFSGRVSPDVIRRREG